jgi:hypothetical protein
MRLGNQSIIKFLTKKENEPEVISELMLPVCGYAALSECHLKYWYKQFKWGIEFMMALTLECSGTNYSENVLEN